MAIPDFNLHADGYAVRPATSIDAKAIRMLAPELPDPATALVAVDGRHNLVVGVVAVARSIRRQPYAGPGIVVRVIEPCRRIGVGKALIAHLDDALAPTKILALYGAQRVDEGSDEHLGWQRLGFEPCETVVEHMLPLSEFEPRLGPLVDKLRGDGQIPPGAQIIPLYQSNLGQVLQLHLDHLGGDRGDLYRKLRGEGVGAFHPRYSRVLLVDGRVRGCILAHRADQETATVDANILDPSVRGGWANIWLKLEATRGAMALGITSFRFTTFDHYTDTRNFTRRMGGATTRTSLLMMRRLPQHADAGHASN